jgi:Tol biopolymer transport system component
VDADGTNAKLIDRCETRLCHGGDRDGDPKWSPDGGSIAFSRERNIWLVDPDGSNLRQLTSCPKTYAASRLRCSKEYPVWSPDGSRIAFQGLDGIYVMNPEATGASRIRKHGYLGSWQPLPEP